eukprot:GHVU01175614.1.p1 GENE.GHVU01175614.1~~GHVU01175614.1.p1  ORF type:complete len:138 (+),score=19.42 GHVU01175614.1:102-515(+)
MCDTFEQLWKELRNTQPEKETSIELIKKFKELLAARKEENQTAKEKTIAWNMMEYMRSHQRFTDWNKEGVMELMREGERSPVFGEKQKCKIRDLLKSGNWVLQRGGGGRNYDPYDGPDDPDRYLGGGEFDIDPGYNL